MPQFVAKRGNLLRQGKHAGDSHLDVTAVAALPEQCQATEQTQRHRAFPFDIDDHIRAVQSRNQYAERRRSGESFVDHTSQSLIDRPHMAAIARLCTGNKRIQQHEYTQSDIHNPQTVLVARLTVVLRGRLFSESSLQQRNVRTRGGSRTAASALDRPGCCCRTACRSWYSFRSVCKSRSWRG